MVFRWANDMAESDESDLKPGPQVRELQLLEKHGGKGTHLAREQGEDGNSLQRRCRSKCTASRQIIYSLLEAQVEDELHACLELRRLGYQAHGVRSGQDQIPVSRSENITGRGSMELDGREWLICRQKQGCCRGEVGTSVWQEFKKYEKKEEQKLGE